jgi:hypothetical protein
MAMTISPEGIGPFTPRLPRGYVFRKFTEKQEAIEMARSLSDIHDEKQVYLWLSPGVPHFIVELGWVRKNLCDEFVGPMLSVVTRRRKIGFVITDELGVCIRVQRPDNPKIRKWVFAAWGYEGGTEEAL